MRSFPVRTPPASTRWPRLRQLAEAIEPPPLPRPVCRDCDDDEVLALAIAVKADPIASGDNDLLVLQQFNAIPILTPAQALEQPEAARRT